MRKTVHAILVSLFTLFALRAHAAEKMRVEKLDLSQYPFIKMYITYVDSDGRVITGRAKEEFHLVLDSADQGSATCEKNCGVITFDTPMPPTNLAPNVNVV